MGTSKSYRRRARGFSLVELSIVVVVVAVLSTLAVVGYSRYRRTARMAEAKHMVTMIRSEQESYKNEKGLYAQISNDATSYYPAANPGKFATQWGGPCGNCVDTQGWSKLPVRPSEPVLYGYATVAGIGEDVLVASVSTMPSDDDSEPPPKSPCEKIGPSQPFYIVSARGDTDGDGIGALVLAMSCSNQLVLTNEGE